MSSRKNLSFAISAITLLTSVSTHAFTKVDTTTLQSDGSSSDTQAAVNAASKGSTVLLPAGSFTWSKGVSISGKSVKLQGAGAGRVVARSATSTTVGTGSKVFTLTDEKVASINALRAAITNGVVLKIWRTGGEVSGGNTTGNLPWMQGTVTSLSGNTLTMDITATNGSGTHPVWFFATEASTTIVSNLPNASILKVTESKSPGLEIAGLRFEHTPTLATNVDTSANFIELFPTRDGQPALVHDCFFIDYTYGHQIQSHTNKGVIWNCSFVSLPFSRGPLAVHTSAMSLSDSWSTPSTMGTADSTGKSNLYIEDCDFHAWLNATDFDDNARSTLRHCLFDNAAFGSHGADSSNFGQRHFEVYDSEFFRNDFSDGQTLNLGWWFLIRGGTGLIADNILPAFGGSDYSGGSEIKLALWNLQFNGGPNPHWGENIPGVQYPCPRQVGMGRVTGTGTDGARRSADAITYVGDSEPLYIWNNTGRYSVVLSAYGDGRSGQDPISNYIVAGRDYFNDGTSKPGYTKYPYPHPLRSAPAR